MEDALARSVAGILGGVVSSTVMHPIDIVQKRIQVSKHGTYDGIWDGLVKTARQNGFLGLYDGLLMTYVQQITKNTAFFSLYETLKALRPPQTTATQLLYGMMAGAVTTIFTTPLQVVTTQMNVYSNRGARVRPLQIIRSIFKQHGFFGFYVGLLPGLVLSVYPAIQHTIFDSLKKWYFKGNDMHKELPITLAFLFGAVANIVALLCTYPLIYIKVRMQAQRHSGVGFVKMISRIVSQGGMAGLWQGLGSQIKTACLATAIMLSTKEKVQEVADTLLAASGANSKRGK